MNDLLYLCCLIPPENDVFREKIEFCARNSEWIEAKTEEDAVKIYQKRYPNLTKWHSAKDVKILSKSPRLLNNIKDGDTDYMMALKAMTNYSDADQEDIPIHESTKQRNIRRNDGEII
jgi:hypothetical protein